MLREDKLLSCKFLTHFSTPHKSKSVSCLTPNTAEQSSSAAAAGSSPPAPPGFSHVRITSPWLCHSCNSCLLIPHCSSSLLLFLLPLHTARTKALWNQQSPWCRMDFQGLPGKCVHSDGNTFAQNGLRLFENCVSWCFGEDQHPENFHLESQQAETLRNLRLDRSHSWDCIQTVMFKKTHRLQIC